MLKGYREYRRRHALPLTNREAAKDRYDPQIARFTQRDPVARPFDLVQGNRYPYAGGDPVNGMDPGGASIFGTLFHAAVGCVKGAVLGPKVPVPVVGRIPLGAKS